MLWEVDIYPRAGQPDLVGERVAREAAELGLAADLRVAAGRGFLLEGSLGPAEVERLGRELLADLVVEQPVTGRVGDARLVEPRDGLSQVIHVLPKPGVMDPVAQSTLEAIADLGLRASGVRTLRKYWLPPLPQETLARLCQKLLANDAIEQAVIGPLAIDHLDCGATHAFEKLTVPILQLDDDALKDVSRKGQLSLSLAEMHTVRDYFAKLGREPSDIELETIAQTWSEHCSHKTLKGRIGYRDERGPRQFENMLRETIFAATDNLRKRWGADDWCVSVFEDNAGIVRFDDDFHVVFKVETHNHPSAIEPYGGANTGLGGVIRDALGTGLGARPVCNTDVFCFAPPDTPADQVLPGALHPKRVLRGVVAGVRDYGNRMGIPTVAGALYFDPRYLGNPLVFCGTAGIIPHDKVRKETKAGDHIVALGGRTGRDGIHGATFSSIELTSESESISGGAVQIGNAITEKMVLDVLLAARDEGLYHAVTDCGAGGFSSAVGEMGAELGAEVWLERAGLKYEGLSYTEIWISEAQERMVLAVPPEHWPRLSALCAAEGVEAIVLGQFVATGQLTLKYHGQTVGELSMQFLHDGRPKVVREAVYTPPAVVPQQVADKDSWDYTPELLAILASLNVASKEWVIRQYDHEVQGGSVVKPLVGVTNDGPSDAAVLRPRLDSRRGLVLSTGMNPCYGDLDPYAMATSAIDEAVRNCVAVGADPRRIALLDNFCWGNTDRSETLGSLVRAALACHDLALELETPFISGKDSLNNEFAYQDAQGQRQTVAIPPSLLISALGQIDDVARAVTMDLKQAGNLLYLVGSTRNELGGSHLSRVGGAHGGQAPAVDGPQARKTYDALHAAMQKGLVRACHDLSEGGLAVAAAEMAFAGGLGARLFLEEVPHTIELQADVATRQRELEQLAGDERLSPLCAWPQAVAVLLFSESNSRLLCEVASEHAEAFEQALHGVPHSAVGEVMAEARLEVVGLAIPARAIEAGDPPQVTAPLVISALLAQLKRAWQTPLGG